MERFSCRLTSLLVVVRYVLVGLWTEVDIAIVVIGNMNRLFLGIVCEVHVVIDVVKNVVKSKMKDGSLF